MWVVWWLVGDKQSNLTGDKEERSHKTFRERIDHIRRLPINFGLSHDQYKKTRKNCSEFCNRNSDAIKKGFGKKYLLQYCYYIAIEFQQHILQ